MNGTPGLRILVVENDNRWQDLIKRHVERALTEINQHGTVHIVENLDDALVALDDGQPWHLVVTDIDLKEEIQMSGMEVVMSTRDKVPCIVISGVLSGAEVDQIYRQFKARRFFAKPPNLSDFNSELKSILIEAVSPPERAQIGQSDSPPGGEIETQRLKPSAMLVEPIFHTREMNVREKRIFIIMPFSKTWSNRVWQRMIKPICEEMGMEPIRGDDLFGRSVMEDIWTEICAARIVIADITDRNANVFYELGIAHTVGKECILLTQREKDIPFDLKSYRHIIYEDTIDGFEKLREQLKGYINAILTKSGT